MSDADLNASMPHIDAIAADAIAEAAAINQRVQQLAAGGQLSEEDAVTINEELGQRLGETLDDLEVVHNTAADIALSRTITEEECADISRLPDEGPIQIDPWRELGGGVVASPALQLIEQRALQSPENRVAQGVALIATERLRKRQPEDAILSSEADQKLPRPNTETAAVCRRKYGICVTDGMVRKRVSEGLFSTTITVGGAGAACPVNSTPLGMTIDTSNTQQQGEIAFPPEEID
jgi:hypothetical protein